MRRASLLFASAAWATAVAMGPLAASAQPPPDPPPTVIELHPAAEPRPALKYRLVPERSTLVPGNAAIFYHRAIQFVIENRARANSEIKPEAGKRAESVDEQISRWGSVPLADFPRDEARKRLEPFQNALKEIELGAKRSTCDWEFDLRNEGISMLLPEVQEMRTLARLVRVQARLEIVDGKTDQAMHWIQIGLVMGRHVSQGPILIQALVGVAIDSMMNQSLIELIQAPGTPSLYWALVDRPQPFIDMRQSLEGERYLLEKELPELNELDRGPWSLGEAQRFTREMDRKLLSLMPGRYPPSNEATALDMTTVARRLGIAAMAAKIYPEARRTLIAEGRPEAEVEAMPIVQVAALHTIQEYRQLRDDSHKWLNLPYWQSYNRLDLGQFTGEVKFANPLLTMFRMLTPSLHGARLATLRLDRQFDALACVEAIRIYAVTHGGKLPQRLDEMIDTPVPTDPATGQPFVYRVTRDTATLTAPIPPGGPDHPTYTINYQLNLSK